MVVGAVQGSRPSWGFFWLFLGEIIMRNLITLIIAMLIASPSSANIETGENMMGFYFDEEANVTTIWNAPSTSWHTMYMILVNPTFDILNGFEVGYTIVGDGMILLTTFHHPVMEDVGSPGNHIISIGSPMPMLQVNVLMTLTVFYMDADADDPLAFFIHGTTPSSLDPDYPTALIEGFELISLGISTWDGYSSVIYGDGIVSTNNQTLDSLKTLYR